MTRATPVPGFAAARMLARLTLRRLTRGRSFWATVVLLVIPLIVAATAVPKEKEGIEGFRIAFGFTALLLAIIPPLHLAGIIAEEVDDKTFTYLWSRPIPRWSVLAGKTMALVPVLVAAFAVSLTAGFVMSWGPGPGQHMDVLGRAIGGMTVGIVGIGMVCVGLGSVLPKFPIPLTIGYIFLFDLPLGALPLSLKYLSFTYHTRVIADVDGGSVVVSLIWSAVIAAAWLLVGLWRVSNAEYSTEK